MKEDPQALQGCSTSSNFRDLKPKTLLMLKRPLSAQFSVAASIYGVLSSGQRGSARMCVCARAPV